jgi:iron complex outermembrane receptor protein
MTISKNKALAVSVRLGSLALATTVSLGAAAQETVLEETIVTAQKREQSLQDVPVAVSALGGESIDDFLAAGENIRALAGRVPSLNIESSNGRTLPRFYIRGLGNIDFDVNAAQPVSMVFDDVVLENGVLKSVPLFDIERVEVLKGPQGTLFGRNTPAGIVKIDSVKPGEENEGYLRGGYGTRSTWGLEGAATQVLSDEISARVAVKYEERNNWIDNTVTGPGDDFGSFEEVATRLFVRYEPSDTFSALVKFHSFEMDGSHPQVFYGNALRQGFEGLRPGFDVEVASHDGSSSIDLSHMGGALTLTWDLANGMTLTSITGYDEVNNFQRADIDGGLIGGPEVIGELGRQAFFAVESGDGLDDHHQLTQELRLSGDSGDLFYQVGLYFFDEAITVRSNNFAPVTEDIAKQDTLSYAAFGQVEYPLADATTLTAGLRFTVDDKELDAIPGINSSAFPDRISADDEYFNWDIALTHQLNDDVSIYGRAGSASRGPVTLGRFGFVSRADTETLTSIEAGIKARLMDGKARWNTTVYYYEIEDQQLTATGGVANVNQLLNADNTIGQGLETELELLPIDNLLITANLSWNDTEIDDSDLKDDACGSTPSCTLLDPIVGMRMGPFGPVTEVSIDGNPLPRAPEWLGNIAVQYSIPMSWGSLYFNTDWNYRDKSNLFLHESVEFVAEERWIGGVRVGIKDSEEVLDLALVGRNITDEVVVDGALNFLNLTAFVNEPEFWGLEATYRW